MRSIFFQQKSEIVFKTIKYTALFRHFYSPSVFFSDFCRESSHTRLFHMVKCLNPGGVSYTDFFFICVCLGRPLCDTGCSFPYLQIN